MKESVEDGLENLEEQYQVGSYSFSIDDEEEDEYPAKGSSRKSRDFDDDEEDDYEEDEVIDGDETEYGRL